MRSDAVRIPLLRALGRLVARVPDRLLESVFGRQPMLWLLFTGMARSYQPHILPGFRGVITFRMEQLLTGRRDCDWTVDVFDTSAVACPGAPPGEVPAIHVTTRVADLIRVATGLLDPGEATLTRGLNVDDFRLGAMIPEMFGAPAPR
jgi:hypothetical protein